MKKRQLIGAAIVLVSLVAVLSWSNYRKPAEDAAKVALVVPLKILSLSGDELSSIEIKKKDGEDVTISKVGFGSWRITSPQPLIADHDQVSNLLTTLSTVNSDRVIQDKATDLKPYGLEDPAVKVTFTANGRTRSLLIGDDNPDGTSAYAVLSDDSRLFTIPNKIKTAFDIGLKDLRDKRLLPVDVSSVGSVEVVGPKLNLTVGSDKGQWIIQNPKEVRGDNAKLEYLMEQVRTAKMDPTTSDVEEKKAASSFSSGTPFATVKVTDPLGTRELKVRKNQDSYYAETTAMAGAYKVSSDLGEALGRDLDFFREKIIFDLGDDNPDKVEMHDGPKSYVLTRSGEDWSMEGKTMDPVTVEAFLHAVRTLAAPKFANAGFSNPTVTLTVTSRDGKRVENVQLAKTADGYIAKREKESLLYVLDATGVEEMLKAADDMKPAEPTKK